MNHTTRLALTVALLSTLATLGVAGSAAGHDIWLQADRYHVEPGDVLIVRQLVGEELTVDRSRAGKLQELPILDGMTPRFELLTAAGATDLLAEHRAPTRPVLEQPAPAVGIALVAMDHDVLYTDHTNEEFLQYLEHEGLDEGLSRAMSAESYQSEGYVRSLKALVRIGEGDEGSTLPGRVLGQPIEVLLLDNPYALGPGDLLRVQVLLAGKPLAGQTVKALNSHDGVVDRHEVVTDGEGIAHLSLSSRGLWMLRLVYLAPCSKGSVIECADATWESYWSAYTFELD